MNNRQTPDCHPGLKWDDCCSRWAEFCPTEKSWKKLSSNVAPVRVCPRMPAKHLGSLGILAKNLPNSCPEPRNPIDGKRVLCIDPVKMATSGHLGIRVAEDKWIALRGDTHTTSCQSHPRLPTVEPGPLFLMPVSVLGR